MRPRHLLFLIGAGLAGGLAAAGVMRLRRQRALQRASFPNPESLIIAPDVPANVTALPNGHMQIQWARTNGHPVKIYAAASHAEFDFRRSVATLKSGNEAQLTGLNPQKRYIYAIRFADGETLYTAQRMLSISGVHNFRDIGGYQTLTGQQVRWGKIYRSADFYHLDANGHRQLQALGVQLVCDLRTDVEVLRRPNALPQMGNNRTPIAPLNLHRPLYGDQEIRRSARQQVRQLLLGQGEVQTLMANSYTHLMVNGKARIFGDLLHWMADPGNHPMVLHCTAGKDRTGLAIALLLSVLGVPDSTIIADYTLTNLFYDSILQVVSEDPGTAKLAFFGLAVADLLPLMTAPPDIMSHTLAYIRAKYGSIESYLISQAGLTPTVIDQLRQNLLY